MVEIFFFFWNFFFFNGWIFFFFNGWNFFLGGKKGGGRGRYTSSGHAGGLCCFLKVFTTIQSGPFYMGRISIHYRLRLCKAMVAKFVIITNGWHPRWPTTWWLINGHQRFSPREIEVRVFLSFLIFSLIRLLFLVCYPKSNESPKWNSSQYFY